MSGPRDKPHRLEIDLGEGRGRIILSEEGITISVPALSLDRKAGVEPKPPGDPLFDLPIGHRLLGAKTAKPHRNPAQKPDTRSGRKGLFRLRWVQFIADRAAWWLLCSLHPRDLGGSETAAVIGSIPDRETKAGTAHERRRSRPSRLGSKFFVARRSNPTGSGRTC